MEVYAWGSGSYGRLGLGHSSDAFSPQLVGGVLNGCNVTGVACGWYHSAIVTSTGDVATFGSKVTKCLGTAGSVSDGSGSEASEGSEASWSGDDGPSGNLSGRSSRRRRADGQRVAPRAAVTLALGDAQRSTADFVPRVLRSFPSRVTIVQVAVGGDMLGAHTLAVSRTGRLYGWGYGPACGVGVTGNVTTPTLVTTFLGTGDSAAGRRDPEEVELYWARHSLRHRKRPTAKQIGLQVLRPRVVKAVCGGGFSAVLSSDGEVFTFGLSTGGRLGFRTKMKAQLRPRRVETISEGAVDLAAGASFMLCCTAAGRLLSWGDNSKGQLGTGTLQEAHHPMQLVRPCPVAFVMQAVACGDSHSLALDSAGRAYSWGGEGGPMTGQGEPLPNSLQVDAACQFQLKQLPHWWVRPCAIRALAGTRLVHIDAGCLHSVALSHDGALYAWGAPMQTSVGSSRGILPGRLEVSWLPRLVAPGPKLPLVQIGTVAAGGWHSMVTAVPSCALEYLLPKEDVAPEVREHEHQEPSVFYDGYLVAQPDSTPEDEARVMLCCSAVRARLAEQDGTDSSRWGAFMAQVKRLPAPEWSIPLPAPPEEEAPSEVEDEEEGMLLEIATTWSTYQQKPRPELSSAADEAAGKALPSRSSSKDAKAAKKPKSSPPVFSSDSDSDPQEKPARPPRPVRPSPKQAAPLRPRKGPPIVFSSDESSEEELVLDRGRPGPSTGGGAASSSQRPPPQVSLGLNLHSFGEAVLLAFVRFLHTDSLGQLEVVDEAHPAWQREQALRLRRRSISETKEAQENLEERASLRRAASGQLLRREVGDLKRLGRALNLERLAMLCDQLLLRLDAPGAPALFVPGSTLSNAMWTLLQQAISPTDGDFGPDILIRCSPPGPRRPRWGPRRLPVDGLLRAHGFVVCSSCSWVRTEHEEPSPRGSTQRPGWQEPSQTSLNVLLKQRPGGGELRWELDLRSVPTEVVYAWLHFLYVQDDLCLTWPLEGHVPESKEAVLAETFWVELLRLGQRLGDQKLVNYAQDVLIDNLSMENWAHMAVFGEQVNCKILLEAAIMMGVRNLHQGLLSSFRVKTGLEGPSTVQEVEEEPEQAATAPTLGRAGGGAFDASSPSHALGSVELELESRLFELRSVHTGAQAGIHILKRGSPAQFAELKRRLSEDVVRAQRVALQLQKCINYFSTYRVKRNLPDDKSRRTKIFEVTVVVLFLIVLLMPGWMKDIVHYLLGYVLEPVQAAAAYLDLGPVRYLFTPKVSIACMNAAAVTGLMYMAWSGLKTG